ncbi:MAG: hypothetical protein CM15mV32_0340 [Caudoviricetes sp.]|nr:MAG: hypothetical protein CM15mV32_0340 [Caudoviricetes sp.]
MAEEVKKEEPKKVGPLGKLKELTEDKEEQMEIFSTFVRLGILIWSGGILTLNYVAIPNFPQKNIDPTFIASVFTGVLASFGIQTAKDKKDKGAAAKQAPQISKADMEKLIEKAANTAPAQTIRLEQAPMVIASSPTPTKKG